jgi:hypothetical protein
MKKSIYVFGVAASLLLASCGGGSETPATPAEGDTTAAAPVETPAEPEVVAAEEVSIVGAWQMADMDLGMELTPEQEADMAAAIAEMVSGSVYTFNEDGTMTMVTPQGEEAGTYKIEPGDEGFVPNLIATGASGEEQTMMLTELSANKLILTMNIDGSIGTMTFTR